MSLLKIGSAGAVPPACRCQGAESLASITTPAGPHAACKATTLKGISSLKLDSDRPATRTSNRSMRLLTKS